MPLSNICTWFRFAVQQMASESYFDDIDLFRRDQVKERLLLGNNRPLLDPSLSGKTRFTNQLAEHFLDTYQIIDHHANDATGFSATLLYDTQNNSYTLSFRSTEYRDQAAGGDWERDGLSGADGEIKDHGFALAQLVSMERYWRELTAPGGKLTPDTKVNVTGYSLSGHLATVFTELHADQVLHTYTFNGAGRGFVSELGQDGQPVEQTMRRMLSDFETRLGAFDPDGALFQSGAAGSIYADARYDEALAATLSQFQTIGTGNLQIFPIPGGIGGGIATRSEALDQITQLIGHAVTGSDLQFVANSGIHAPSTTILIEGQPLLEGLDSERELQYGNTHSLTLIVDSLALQEVFQAVDPTLTQTQIEAILKASSDAQAAVIGQTRVAEGDTLELALDALRKVFLTGQIFPTDFDDNAGGFGNLALRDQFYANLAEVRTEIATNFADQTLRIECLVGKAQESLMAEAAGTAPTSLAYRYALKELNPFIVRGIDHATTESLYSRHNETGELSLIDPATGTGDLTPQYLADRAAFLTKKIEINSTLPTLPTATHFHDYRLQEEIGTAMFPLPQVLFGDDSNETLAGSASFEDHLYGGSGDDHLLGLGGNDYLEGNKGNDALDGGIGADTMLGGSGNDLYSVDNAGDVVREYANSGIDEVRSSVTFTLDSQVENLTLTGFDRISGIGNELNNTIVGNLARNVLTGLGGQDHLIGNGGNDVLAGGIGDGDQLEGGEGFDTYIYNEGDGTDRIQDSDAKGQVLVDGRLLQGGYRLAGSAPETFTSLDGLTTYVSAGTHLIVNGGLVVSDNFRSGDLGIRLIDLTSAATGQAPDVSYDRTISGGAADEFVNDGLTNLSDDQLFGGQGRDVVQAGGGQDALYGGEGDDLLVDVPYGEGEADLLDGGAGNDYLSAGIGDDIAYGGDADDILLGSSYDPERIDIAGRDYLDGGNGSDYLWGGPSDDVLMGGGGDDVLRGDNLPGDVAIAVFTETGYSVVPPPNASAVVLSASGGADFLDGGAGHDLLQGDAGNDVLIGGAGNDRLYGDNQDEFAIDEGDDALEGGDGDDQLFAAGGNDSLSGGAGLDQLYGDRGDDRLDGGEDADLLVGGDGADVLFGGAGNDLLFGEGLNNPFEAVHAGGDDFLDGGEGDDELQGGVGDDSLFGGTGSDRLFGLEGNDSLLGDDGTDELQGGVGQDTLYGDAGNDALFGQEDDDLLSGDAGDDFLNGGLGNDQLDGGEGIDDLQGREGNDSIRGGTGNDFLYGDGNDPTVLSMGGGHDTLDGEEGDDQLWAGTGDDQLFGGEGEDQLVGDGGDDTLYGEAGNDLLFGDSPFFPDVAGSDLLDGGDGHDVIQGGGGDDQLVGGTGDDVLFGELADDAITGAGRDLLHGGTGNDTLHGGFGSDTYLFNVGDGTDTITDVAGQGNRLVFGDGIDAASLMLSIGAGDSLVLNTGQAGDAVRISNFGINTPSGLHPIESFEFADGTVMTFDQLAARGFQILGTTEADSLHGTNFDDSIMAGAGDDVVFASQGTDIVHGEDGADALEGGAGNDVLYGGNGNDRLIGGAGADVLDGGAGDDVLTADSGTDRMIGGAGSDIYLLLQPDPDIIESPNEGIDTIRFGLNDSFLLALPANVENIELDESRVYSGNRMSFLGNELDNNMTGANLLDGQAGNDTLIGVGDNIYVFGRGYGQDLIVTGTQRHASDGFLDQIQMLPGVAPTELALEGHGNNLVLRVDGTTDQLTIENYLIEPGLRVPTVGRIVFDDGTVWNAEDIDGRVRLFMGTDNNDTLVGFDNDNELRGLDGDDQLSGGSGNDTLDGGAGNDLVSGGDGSDTYHFGRGAGQDAINDFPDTVNGGDVDTVLLDETVTPEDVRLQALPDFDLLLTINGTTDQLLVENYFYESMYQVEQIQFADGTTWGSSEIMNRVEGLTLVGTDDADALTGLITNDTLTGLGGDDELIGEGGHDLLLGGDGSDRLEGRSGNDTLDGGRGADTLIGGTGNDLYIIENLGDLVTEQANQGTDTVHSAISYTLGANLENLTLTGTAAINGTGNTGNNILSGNSAANVLTGGTGNDTYVVGAGDTVVEQTSSGTDTIESSLSWTLGNNVENLTLTGELAIDGTGNSLKNTLLGNSAANVLNGMQGADRMTGGRGDDTYVVDNTGDVVSEYLNEGNDTVLSSITHTLSAHVENLTLTGTTAINGTGNSLNNVLTGNSAANRLTGGAGDDTYIIGAGDTVVESSGGGTDTVQSSVTHTLAANVENLTLIGTAAINGTGNALNNVLIGNSAANTLTGGAGNDTYVVGAGDTVVEAVNGGTDTVQSAVTWTLASHVEQLTLTGTAAIQGTGNSQANVLTGNAAANTLTGEAGNDSLSGGRGNDLLIGGAGDDTFHFVRGDGQDLVQDTSGSADRMQFGASIDPLDLVISRQANDLRLAVHGTQDQVTIQNWYNGASNQTEVIQAGNGQQLVNTQVEQLIQAMASFTQQSGLSWEQAIEQRPQDVQTILAASWQ